MKQGIFFLFCTAVVFAGQFPKEELIRPSTIQSIVHEVELEEQKRDSRKEVAHNKDKHRVSAAKKAVEKEKQEWKKK